MKSPETVAELGQYRRILWPEQSDGGVRAAPRIAELDFLPAALELIERPAAPAARAISWSILALAVIAVAWAWLSHVDIVSTAQGKLVPAGQVKTIQPLEIGTVKAIAVVDGQHVAAGEMLIELDPTSDAAEQDRIARDALQARLDIARLEALLSGSELRLPAGLDPVLASTESSMLDAERHQRAAKLDTFTNELARKKADLAGAQTNVAKLAATIPLISQRVAGKKELLEKQYASRFSYLELRQTLVEQQHELEVQRHRVEEAQSAIASLGRQREEAAAAFRRDTLDQLIKARSLLDRAVQDGIKARQRTELTRLTAPVAGTVQQLAVHTVGGVVTPAQALLVIVPDDLKLEIEAKISNRDIGFVHEGQTAEVKIVSFDFTHYGILRGVVRQVSRDALPPDDKTPSKDLFFSGRIVLDSTAMDIDGRQITLSPGMLVTTEIKTGRRRILDYLLSPIFRYRHQTLRER